MFGVQGLWSEFPDWGACGPGKFIRAAPVKTWGEVDRTDCKALEMLGWTAESWDAGYGPTAHWSELDEIRRAIAASFGYDEEGASQSNTLDWAFFVIWCVD